MQKIGSCGGERFAPATLINQEKSVEEEDKGRIYIMCLKEPTSQQEPFHICLHLQKLCKSREDRVGSQKSKS